MTYGFADVDTHFREEIGPEGPWEPRSQRTQEAYAAISAGLRKTPRGASTADFNPTNKLLQMTGRLKTSINPKGIRNIPGGIEIFSNVQYSRVHQKGSKRGIPKRDFLWLTERAKDKMLDLMWKIVMGEGGAQGAL